MQDDKISTVIKCRDVWKLYGDKPERYVKSIQGKKDYKQIQKDGYIAAVRGVSIDIMEGEILVVMGLSGSGKSTLLRCLSRLIEVTSGSIYIGEQNLASLTEKQLIELRRDKMAMVFQNFALLPHRNVLDNVAFPLEMRGQNKQQRRKRALEVIKLVSLQGREQYFPRELSGGQQQRVGIARSLAIEPDIWFLDEPFSALDPLIRREMQNEFLRLQNTIGKTIVFVTHDFDEALRLADRIAIMKDGVIEQIDKPADIVLRPANDYVAKFTEDVNKAKVVKLADILENNPEIASGDKALNKDSNIQEAAYDIIKEHREIIPVCDENKNIIGTIKKQAALEVLLEKKPDEVH